MPRRTRTLPTILVLAVAGALTLGAAGAARGESAARDRGADAPQPAYLDANQDGRISREEFLRFRRALFFGPEDDRPHWDDRSRLAFAACDIDGDGVLTQAELRDYPACAP